MENEDDDDDDEHVFCPNMAFENWYTSVEKLKKKKERKKKQNL
jgi:hypothetical protein